ncbi:MAG: hypothetical protein ACRD2J_00665 [Thermoanaerobaculia bacterium]
MIRHLLAATTAALVLAGCTGGQETAAETLEAAQEREAAEATADAKEKLGALGSSLPLYAGAQYREDFTRRDAVMIRNQYGDRSEVITLASDDALPKVWHYYVTYLAQFRAWDPAPAFPPEDENWRTFEVNLSDAMQDPFIPGTQLKATDRNVILQITETEAEPPTIIRYIVTPTKVAMSQ